MTKVPQGFDFSFLNDEEARKILQVLERNEELQRAEKDRISKLQKTKRDIRWLQGVTNQRNPTPVPSRLSFRSFSSLFSFKKSRKEPLKLQSLGQKG